MCGIAALFGRSWKEAQIAAMVEHQRHRGPDSQGLYRDPEGEAWLGHDRLTIIDLTDRGFQPMASNDGRYHLTFNGEIYNYKELRRELSDYDFRSDTDSEVLLAAYLKWGATCLNRFIGMFAFAIWDERDKKLFAARDRFGVKPLYYVHRGGELALASEIGALFAAGVEAVPNETTWATYLVHGVYDHLPETFWQGITRLPPGHLMDVSEKGVTIRCWYDIAEVSGQDFDPRSEKEVADEYLGLLEESVSLRFRADVPVGVNLSGGLDSTLLLGLIEKVHGAAVDTFTFATGDDRYDELPHVGAMLEGSSHRHHVAYLEAEEVRARAEAMHGRMLEPFGGIPTVAYGKTFELATQRRVSVVMDGQGMDEQWAGYDYYRSVNGSPFVQGQAGRLTRPELLDPGFTRHAISPRFPEPFPDRLRNLQYRDIGFTKIPRALRFNDLVSMSASVELREPFLDHRLMELSLSQLPERKIRDGQGKVLLRSIARHLLPSQVVNEVKRPIQTPQTDWLAKKLVPWVKESIRTVEHLPWFDSGASRKVWRSFDEGPRDSSFYIWQLISVSCLLPGSVRPIATGSR